MELDPVVLLNIFWDENPLSKEWNCELENSLPKFCKHKVMAVQITWQERKGHHRLIEIDSPKVNAQLSLDQLEEDVHLTATTFHLKAPENFKLIRL